MVVILATAAADDDGGADNGGADDGGADDGAGAPTTGLRRQRRAAPPGQKENIEKDTVAGPAAGPAGGTLSNVVGGPVGLVELGLRGDAWAPSDQNEAKAKRNFY